MARARFKLFVGGAAVRAADVGESIMKLRGTPIGHDGLATLHPSFVLRDSGRLFRDVFRFDVAKAVRLHRGGNTWHDPPYKIVTTVSELEEALTTLDLSGKRLIAVDTETDGIDPWRCRIRRVGIGDGTTTIIFCPLSVHGHFLEPTQLYACYQKLARFFARPLPYAFHNFYAYDSIVLSQHGVVVNEENLFDSLIGHHLGPTAEFPHGLDFLGSIYTDAPRWKDDVKHSTTKSDEILDRYLSFDVAVTHTARQIVQTSVEMAQQDQIYNLDVVLARAGRSMARLGVRIDPEKRAAFVTEYEAKADELKAAFVAAAGKEVNPGSVKQVKQLLYSDFGLPVIDEYRTETDEPSTGEPALLDLLARGVDSRATKVIQALLGWRAADKILGTYVGRFGVPNSGLPVHDDGRIRATWKVSGTVSGRWSSSPNLQNIPDRLRAMFVPDDENVFVAADYSAVDLRVLALLANDRPLIDAFAAQDAGGIDVHTFNACTVFKCQPEKVTKEVRTFAKRFVYGLSYGAEPPKIFQTMSLLRNDDLTPVFPGLTLSDIEHAYKAWWKAHPAISAFRCELIRGWRRHGFIATPWHGRRRYFIGGENHEEMYCHPIQGGAADLKNSAIFRLIERYPFDYEKSCGLILDGHDQLVVECRANDAERVKAILSESMQTQVGPMRFPAEVKIGKSWKDV
jgi:DNA polymerase-1